MVITFEKKERTNKQASEWANERSQWKNVSLIQIFLFERSQWKNVSLIQIFLFAPQARPSHQENRLIEKNVVLGPDPRSMDYSQYSNEWELVWRGKWLAANQMTFKADFSINSRWLLYMNGERLFIPVLSLLIFALFHQIKLKSTTISLSSAIPWSLQVFDRRSWEVEIWSNTSLKWLDVLRFRVRLTHSQLWRYLKWSPRTRVIILVILADFLIEQYAQT